MLSTDQKATILGKAGWQVPDYPASEEPTGTRAGKDETADAPVRRWVQAVENLFATYAAARAAKSLREAEEARQRDMLRRMAAKSYA